MKTSGIYLLGSSLLLAASIQSVRADFVPTSLTGSAPLENLLERRHEVEKLEAQRLHDRDRQYEQVTRDARAGGGFPWHIAVAFSTVVLMVPILLYWRRWYHRRSSNLALGRYKRLERARFATTASDQSQARSALFSVISMLKPSSKRRHRHRHRSHRHHHRHSQRRLRSPESSSASKEATESPRTA